MNISEIKDIGYKIKNDQDADYVINTLKNQLQFYKNKNVQNSTVLSKLKLTPDSLSFASRETLDKFTKLQDASGVNKLELVDIQMSYLEYATARYNYQNKSNILKGHLEELQQLTAEVTEETEIVEREINTGKALLERIAPIFDTELQKIKLQIESYEDKLLHFINKYPWLNEPEYNLLSIQEEIKKVYRLQDELKELKKGIECYAGLKPDLYTAKNQLAKIKTEYETISKLVSDKECSK